MSTALSRRPAPPGLGAPKARVLSRELRLSPAERAQRRVVRWMLLPVTTLLVALTVAPFLSAVFISLTEGSSAVGAVEWAGLRNYLELLSEGAFWNAVRLTATFTVLAVGIEFLLGLAVALALWPVRRGASVLRAIYLLPMAATPVAVLFIWKTGLNPTQGVANYLLGSIGLPEPDWFGTATGALLALVIVDVWQWTPLILVILAGGLASLPRDVLEAAAVDGASAWQRFRHVVAPMLAPFVALALLFRVIDALRTFDSFQILTGGGPGDATTTLNMLAYRQSIQFLDFGRGAAVALLLLALSILCANLMLRTLRRVAP